MWAAVNRAANAVFDIWLWPFQGLDPVWQVCITALPVTAVALLIFKYASNQAGITAAKDKIKAYLLELWLYKDDIGILLRAQGRVLGYSLIYMRYSLVPMAIMIVPFALVIVQLESNFAFRALESGESAILGVAVETRTPVSGLESSITVPEGLVLATPALRSDATGEVFWRIEAGAPGRHEVDIRIGDHRTTRVVVAGEGGKLWPVAYPANDWRVLGSAAEPALDPGGGILSTEVAYVRARGEFLGLSSASWWLLGFSLLFGFALRGLFGVTF